MMRQDSAVVDFSVVMSKPTSSAATPNLHVIININHETGDLSQYTSTVTDSGDLSVTAGAALAGTGYGLSCLIDDTTNIYGAKALASPYSKSNIWRIRFYLDPNSITMANANRFNVCHVFTSSAAKETSISLYYTTVGGYQIRLYSVDDAAATKITADYPITDAPHYIEFLMTRASGESTNDGSMQLWIDGVSKEAVTGIDNYTVWTDLRTVRVGATGGIDAGTSGTFYLDELVVNDDGSLIGA